ncbi:uncharacterized protein METZ01_LOCUS195114, partial [marine metagenome]
MENFTCHGQAQTFDLFVLTMGPGITFCSEYHRHGGGVCELQRTT